MNEINGFKIEERSAIPAGENPFRHDSYNMGQTIGKNLTVMFGCHQSEHCNYIILIDTVTGKRIIINPPSANFVKDSLQEFVNKA